MRVLVTGGHGFIGTHLVRRLLEEGAEVRCLVRGEGRPAGLAGVDAEVVRGDVRHPETLAPAVRGVDEVYHLAGLTSALTWRAMRATNTLGTGHLLAAAERAGVSGRFLLCSSLAAVGPSRPGRPHVESDPCRPITWYGRSKLEAEALVRAQGERLPATILRPPSVYGPRDVEFLRLFEAAARGLALMPGPPTRAYSLVHASDLAEALLVAARSPATLGGTWFATHADVVPLERLVRAAEAAVERPTRRIALPESLMRLLGRAIDLTSQLSGRSSILGSQRMIEVSTGDWACSAEALSQATGWRAATALEEGFAETVAWYRAQGWLPGSSAPAPIR